MDKQIFEVRDNEVYSNNMVHNSQYFNYLEFSRNKYLRNNGIDFFDLASNRGMKMTMIKAEQEFKNSLKAKDKFYITTKIIRLTSIQFLFEQDIYLLPNNVLVLKSKTIGILIGEKGTPIRVPKDLGTLLNKMGIKTIKE